MNEFIDIKDLEFPKGCPKVEFYRHPDYCEIVLYLFTKCNLRCEFCFQEHSADLDMNYIKKIPDMAIELLKKDIDKEPTIKQIDIRLLGGELFADAVPDSYFDVYAELVQEIRRRLNEMYPDKKIVFIVTSNGVYSKVERLVKFLEDNDFKKLVSISIDFIGRYPNEKVKQRAYDTIKELADRGCDVRAGLVMTKRNLNYIMAHKQEFRDLVEKYNATQITFNFYIPNNNWEKDLPTDNDMWQFFEFCLSEKLFYVGIIFYLMESFIRQKFFTKTCECKFIPTVTDGCVTKDCTQTASTLDRHMFYGNYVDELNEENVSDVKASLGITKRGCLACEHYSYCPQMCWCLLIFEHFKAEACPLASSYAFIKAHPELVDEYKKWKKERCSYEMTGEEDAC